MSDDDFNERAADMVLEVNNQYEDNLAEQEAFLDTVSEEEGAEVLETKCTLMGEHTVPLKAKLSGEIMDRLGHIDDKLEQVRAGETGAYEVGNAADEASQLLADVIDDPQWHKDVFYSAYESEGINPLGVMIERVFDSLQQERERRQGSADGFRKKPKGS